MKKRCFFTFFYFLLGDEKRKRHEEKLMKNNGFLYDNEWIRDFLFCVHWKDFLLSIFLLYHYINSNLSFFTADFPLMTLYVVPKLRGEASDIFVENARKNALDIFDPSSLGFCGDHFFHLCREVSYIYMYVHKIYCIYI